MVEEILIGLEEPQQAKSSKLKNGNFETILNAIEINPMGNTQRVSGEPGIS